MYPVAFSALDPGLRCLKGFVNPVVLKWAVSLPVALAIVFALVSPALASDGTVIGNLAAQMQPGTWAELTSQNIQSTLTSSGSSQGITSYANSAAWDPVSRRLFFIGGDHNDAPRFVSYSAQGNSWQVMPLPPFLVGVFPQWHGYDYNTIDVGKGKYYVHYEKYDIGSGTWSSIPAIPGVSFGRAHSAVDYFPELKGLVVIGDDAAYLYDDTTNQWKTLATNLAFTAASACTGCHPIAEYNPVHKVVYFGGGDGSNKMYKLDSTGKITALKAAPLIIGIMSAQVTVDPVTGDYLVFGKDGSFWVYNIVTDTWTRKTGSIPITDIGQLITAPLSSYGVTLFVERNSSMNFKAYLYKHAASSGSPAPPPTSGAMTFDQACALSTTISCWGFENETDLYYWWPQGTACDSDPFLRNHPNGGPHGFGLDRQGSKGNIIANVDNVARQCVYPKRDSTYASSGNSSLKFTMVSQSGPAASGDFTEVFKRIGNPPNSRFARFGPGGEFWFRFSMRQSSSLITTVLRAVSGGFGGVKRVIIHGYESSETLEETINDGWQRRLPQMYSNSGREDYGIQNVIGCTLKNPDVASSYTEPPCRKFKADVWRSYQVHVKVADNAQKNNGLVELYIDDEPTPIIRVTNADMSTACGPPYTESALWDGLCNGYGKFSFTLYSTNKDASQTHPEAYMWIDDVVISHVRVPRLEGTIVGGGSGGGDLSPPAAPTGLRIQ
jgi:hypothetical protein